MNHLVINQCDLIYSNTISRTKNWPRHFKEHDFKDIKKFDKKQEWPIHFSIKMREDCMRILFEHANGELYQLDIPDIIYEKLKLNLEEEVTPIVYN
tara:strand:+ start:21628 stop:21915 length:288 start_codon:yes stop_codon:yes gene_type:complete